MAGATIARRLAEKLMEGKLAKAVTEQLARHLDPAVMRLAVRELRTGKLLTKAANSALARIDALLLRLPKLLPALEFRTKSFAHLFGKEMERVAADAARGEYLRGLDELRDIAKTEAFAELMKTPAGRTRVEEQAKMLMRNLSLDTIDRYGDLKRETYALNALTKRLYPDDFGSLRVDAQHVVEQRAFEKFKADWKLLGWNSVEDMPAMPVMWEWHIRSPGKLPGFETAEGMYKLPKSQIPIEEVKSLTKELFDAADIQKIKTAEELLNAYRAFYERPNKYSRYAKPMRPFVKAIDEIERALTRARTQSKLVQQAKAMKK